MFIKVLNFMKKNNLFTVLIFLHFTFLHSQNREWEDLSIFSINTEKPHATFYPFSNEKLLIENDLKNNNLYTLLNGEWDFKLYKNIDSVPKNFYQKKSNVKQWKKIPVPSNWQFHSKDFPVYSNIIYPYEINPPYMPKDYNPVGLYHKKFKIDKHGVTKRFLFTLGVLILLFTYGLME